jgi:ribosomal protein S16
VDNLQHGLNSWSLTNWISQKLQFSDTVTNLLRDNGEFFLSLLTIGCKKHLRLDGKQNVKKRSSHCDNLF